MAVVFGLRVNLQQVLTLNLLYQYKCENGVFYVDMQTFVNEEQMKAYEDMEMEISMKEINIPAELKAGQMLDDGNIIMTITGMPMPMKVQVDVKNRKVEQAIKYFIRLYICYSGLKFKSSSRAKIAGSPGGGRGSAL